MDMDAVYREHAQMVYLYLMSLCNDTHLAQDLTEDTFLKAMRTIDTWRGDCALASWLCAIARNEYLSDRRRHKRRAAQAGELPDHAQDAPETSLLREERYLALMRRVHALGEDAREVFYLRAMGDMTFAQIGSVMGRTENWARVTYYRAKERIRREMDEDDG